MSCDEELSSEELLQRKQTLSSIIYSSIEDDLEVPDKMKKITDCVKLLPGYNIEEAEEDLFKHVMPVILQIIEKLYVDNMAIAQTDDTEILNTLKANLKDASSLVKISQEILQYVSGYELVNLIQVESIPINLANIILKTLDHLKCSQNDYHCNFRSIAEILNLFKRAQNLHTKFLKFLELGLVFQIIYDQDTLELKNLMGIMCRISDVVSEMNIKSMVDNWKGFSLLSQKYSTVLNDFDFSLPIKIVANQIGKDLDTIARSASTDLERAGLAVKVIRFIITVVLRLLDIFPSIFQKHFRAIFDFFINLYSFPQHHLLMKKLPDDFISDLKAALYSTTEQAVESIIYEEDFIKQVNLISDDNFEITERQIGFVAFSNELFKGFIGVFQSGSGAWGAKNIKIAPLLKRTLACVKDCYKEFCWDSNSVLYEDLVVNIATVVLLFPDQYIEVEGLLLTFLLQDDVWTALMAMDIWCLVLKNASVDTCMATLSALIIKKQELRLGLFSATPALIFLKIQMEQIFKMLPVSASNDLISKNPQIWSTVSMRHLSLPQRFHVEFVLMDLLDKVGFVDKENSTWDEAVFVGEKCELVSSIDWNKFQMQLARLVPGLVRFWSASITESSLNNIFFSYFFQKVCKVSSEVVAKFTGDNVLLVLNQCKPLMEKSIFKLLICDILTALSRRDFSKYQEKVTLFALLVDIFTILLADENPVIVQIVLETLENFKNDNYETILNKITTSSQEAKKFSSFLKGIVPKPKYEVLEAIQHNKLQHRCLEWTQSDHPQCKRVKTEDEVDVLIDSLQSTTERLTERNSQLNAIQMTHVKSVIGKLEALLI